MVGPLMRGRRGAPALQPASANTTGPDDGALLGAVLAHCAAALRVACHLLRVPVQQRPLRSVGGVGDVDACVLEPVANLVGLRPVPLFARRRAAASAPTCTSTSTAASAADVSSRDSQRSSSGSQPRMPIIARIDRACSHRGLVVARVERPVALGPRRVHLGQRHRHGEVVVERGGELRRPVRRAPRCRRGCAPGAGSPRCPCTPSRRPAARSRRTPASTGSAHCPGSSAVRRAGPAAAPRGSTARCQATCSSSRRPW